MQVCSAVAADLVAWLVLAGEVEPLFGPMVDDPGFARAVLRNVERGTAWCVREGDGAPGEALLAGLLFSPGAPRREIGWLAVTARARRLGLAHALVRRALAGVAPPSEVDVVTFGADHPGGAAARAFYQRLGFALVGPAPRGPEGGSRALYRLALRPGPSG